MEGKIVCVFGGSDIEKQIRSIKKGSRYNCRTPGRVMDLMRRKVLKFDNVKYVVLDEADEMLNMGFVEDIETILEKLMMLVKRYYFQQQCQRELKRLLKIICMMILNM